MSFVFALHKTTLKLERTMHKFTKALAAIGLAAVMSQSAMAENLKLGFLVKQPEEPWFQTEWKFADKAGKDLGFEVIKIAVPDGEKTLNAIDSLAASGAKGFVIRELRKEGRVILYVSHRMEEIFALSDAITVFKDGRYVKTFTDMQQVDHDALVQAMVGRDIGDIYGWQPRSYGEERLRLDAVKAPGVRTPISLAVRSGEIVGLFGLVGAGRSELMKGLFGGTQITAGQVYIDQQPIDIRKPSHAIAAGMMLCPEDRKAEGIIPVHSVRDNINISARRKHVLGGCVINNGWEENNADHHIRSLNIKTPGAEQLIMNLSGGNQQKAILGRWLSEEMKVILLDEPTRGIDVGAKHEIYNVIYALAAQGVAVLFASSDLPEVLGVADRIVVMREGEIAGELLHEQADERQALSLAMPKVSQAVA
ncbi:TPA: ATP-binding cassette domain-containing protein [Escherichia coli]